MRSSWAGVMAADSSWWWVSLGSCHRPLEVVYVYSCADEFSTLGRGQACDVLFSGDLLGGGGSGGGVRAGRYPVLSVAPPAPPRERA